MSFWKCLQLKMYTDAKVSESTITRRLTAPLSESPMRPIGCFMTPQTACTIHAAPRAHYSMSSSGNNGSRRVSVSTVEEEDTADEHQGTPKCEQLPSEEWCVLFRHIALFI